jgi:hypothetical protein
MNVTLVFEKKANYFAEKWQKSTKIRIITSTPVTRIFMTPNIFVNLPPYTLAGIDLTTHSSVASEDDTTT